MTEHVALDEITPQQAELLQRVMADEFGAADRVCIDFWGPDARRARRILDGAPGKPPVLMPQGTVVAPGCFRMLRDHEPMHTDSPRLERSRKTFEAWVRMHIEHRRYCVACTLGNEMPGGFR